jgi:hypothetical protein
MPQNGPLIKNIHSSNSLKKGEARQNFLILREFFGGDFPSLSGKQMEAFGRPGKAPAG